MPPAGRMGPHRPRMGAVSTGLWEAWHKNVCSGVASAPDPILCPLLYGGASDALDSFSGHMRSLRGFSGGFSGVAHGSLISGRWDAPHQSPLGQGRPDPACGTRRNRTVHAAGAAAGEGEERRPRRVSLVQEGGGVSQQCGI